MGWVCYWLSAQRPIVATLPGCLLPGLIAAATIFARARGRRSIRTRGYLMCPRCGYGLGGLAPAGDCPECGLPYSPILLRDEWEWAYRGVGWYIDRPHS